MNFETQIHKLPCGYQDQDGFFYNYVEVKEMSGNEEDLLTNRRKVQSGAAFDEVIAQCCVLLKVDGEEDPSSGSRKVIKPEEALNMRQGDRYACFVWIRQVSYGNHYKFQIKCPDCQKTQTFDLDLPNLKVTYMPTPTEDFYDAVLPRNGDTITFKINTGKEERKMEKMNEQNPGDAATINLAVRLVKVNGETVRPSPYLKKLTVKDRHFYRQSALDHEGYIENEIDIVCSSCDLEFKTEIPIQRNFFLPTTE